MTASRGVATGKGDVDRKREDRSAETRERGGDAGERRTTRPGVAKHLDGAAIAEVERLPAADDRRDHREEVSEEREVAHQQCAPLEDEEALVDPGAPTAAAREQDADVRRWGHAKHSSRRGQSTRCAGCGRRTVAAPGMRTQCTTSAADG